ncbi:MAG: hypothetical protein ABIS46_03395 [Sphingomicrobium sp.]
MFRLRVLASVAIAATIAATGGCGRVADLEPAAGKALPVKPLMARTTPTAEELLTPPANARPDRIDELLKRSERRNSDPFDLPPPTGGTAPAAPAGAVPDGIDTNDTGPAGPGF